MGNYLRKIKCFFRNQAAVVEERRIPFSDPIIRERKIAEKSFVSGVLYFLGGDYWHAKRSFEVWRYLKNR